MWHASVAPQGLLLPESFLRKVAFDALDGVGDASLGQWEEAFDRFFHLKRRLSEAEQGLVGAAIDIRGTDEQTKRWLKVRQYLPEGYKNRKE